MRVLPLILLSYPVNPRLNISLEDFFNDILLLVLRFHELRATQLVYLRLRQLLDPQFGNLRRRL